MHAVLWGHDFLFLPGQSAQYDVNRSRLECLAVEGESPVGEDIVVCVLWCPSSSGLVESAVNLPGPPGKPKYFLVTDSGLVP